MYFAVTVDNAAMEYGCKTVNAALAQRANVLRPAFWRMIRDIMVFNRTTLAVAQRDPRMKLEGLIQHQRLGERFTRYYLPPMSGPIWSTPREKMRVFPALALVRFFENHRLLSLNGQHQWWTVDGGSREYANPMPETMRTEVRLKSPVTAVERGEGGVALKTAGAPADADRRAAAALDRGTDARFAAPLLRCGEDDRIDSLAGAEAISEGRRYSSRPEPLRERVS